MLGIEGSSQLLDTEGWRACFLGAELLDEKAVGIGSLAQCAGTFPSSPVAVANSVHCL